MSIVVLTVFGLMALLLGAGLWIGVSLIAVGAAGLQLFKTLPVDRLLAQVVWNTTSGPELIALPLFVLMGEILYHTRLSAALFRGLAPWMRRLPGRLYHVNVVGATLFAAVSGSSAATTATVGRVSLAELAARGYDRGLAIGSLAGAGTLGFLIPPSIVMIVYGVLADTSILALFVAGVLPGLALSLLFAAYVAARCIARPSLVPADEPGATLGLGAALLEIAPVAALIVAIVGSIYGGVATPTEAAAVGVGGAIALGVAQRGLGPRELASACMGAVGLLGMIGLVMIGASFLSVAMGFLGVPREVARVVAGLELTPLAIVLVLLAVYVLLGMLLDGLSMIVMTLPFALPMVELAGYDRVWFGVFLVLVVEMAQITPPVGFNLYVLHGLTGEPIGRIARAALPFFAIMVAFVLLIALFPPLVTWLPSTVGPGR